MTSQEFEAATRRGAEATARKYPLPFACDCAAFLRGKIYDWQVWANLTGKSSQPWLEQGANVKGRCRHEAYHAVDLRQFQLNPKAIEVKKINL